MDLLYHIVGAKEFKSSLTVVSCIDTVYIGMVYGFKFKRKVKRKYHKYKADTPKKKESHYIKIATYISFLFFCQL